MADHTTLSSDVATQFKSVLKAVVLSTRASNGLPRLGEDYEVLSAFPVFSDLMKVEGNRIIELIQRLFRTSSIRVSLGGGTDSQLDRLIECNDALLERIGNCLDEAAGKRKAEEPLRIQPSLETVTLDRTASWNRYRSLSRTATGPDHPYRHASLSRSNSVASLNSGRSFPVTLLGARNIPRPQLQFGDTIDNASRPFLSKLRHKHNTLKRPGGNIQLVVSGCESESNSTDICTDQMDPIHPYQYELEVWIPSDAMVDATLNPQLPTAPNETDYIFIDTFQQLRDLRDTLNKQPDFSVDVEHHSYRSFLGITCLVQITTREPACDYVIDALELWRYMQVLNEPFTNPSIIKVFHGAESDIQWLQRDFGIYVVGMFDTGQAARVLEYPKFSLSFLLKHLVEVDTRKEYQLADWRIRPLPDEMIKYARTDTHYLLYCYDRLRQELVDRSNADKNLIKAVFMRSRDICLQHYEKPLFHENDYVKLATKGGKHLNSRQLLALKNIYAWRDNIARSEDESTRYVLPDHMLLQISEVLPREAQGILACCNPVPPMVKQELHNLHQIIYHARTADIDEGVLEAPVLSSVRADVNVTAVFHRREPHPLLCSQHDFSHTAADEEIGEKGPDYGKWVDMIGSDSDDDGERLDIEKQTPFLKAFDSGASSSVKRPQESSVKRTWVTPFEQYKLAEARRAEGFVDEEEAEIVQPSPAPSAVQNWAENAQEFDTDVVPLVPSFRRPGLTSLNPEGDDELDSIRNRIRKEMAIKHLFGPSEKQVVAERKTTKRHSDEKAGEGSNKTRKVLRIEPFDYDKASTELEEEMKAMKAKRKEKKEKKKKAEATDGTGRQKTKKIKKFGGNKSVTYSRAKKHQDGLT